MAQQIGICLVGAGRAGLIHAHNFQGKIPQAKVVAVVDPNQEAAEKAAKELGVDRWYTSVEPALDNRAVDAVVIATPTRHHKAIAVAASEAGKHILCEKPMAMDEEECDAMIEAAERNNVQLHVAFMRRFDSSFRLAKKMVESGEIGDVVLVKSTTRGPSIPQRWQYDIAQSNGPLAEVNSHDIDTIRWFSDSEFKSVYAIAGNYRCPEAKEEFPDFYDNVIMIASLTGGQQAFVDGAVSVKYGYDARVEILGEKGVITVGQHHEGSVVICSQGSNVTRPVMKSWRNLFAEAYLAEDLNFVTSILEGRPPLVSGVDGKMVVKVVQAGNTSILEKRIVHLE